MKYARIKSCKCRLPFYLTEGKWYEVLTYNSFSFSYMADNNIKNTSKEYGCYHLSGGDWEIVDGNEIKYKSDNNQCKTQCPHVYAVKVGSIGCQTCLHHISLDRDTKTVICSKEKEMGKTYKDVYEALADAEDGDKVKIFTGCEISTITKGRVGSIVSDSGVKWNGWLGYGKYTIVKKDEKKEKLLSDIAEMEAKLKEMKDEADKS